MHVRPYRRSVSTTRKKYQRSIFNKLIGLKREARKNFTRFISFSTQLTNVRRLIIVAMTCTSDESLAGAAHILELFNAE